jgi:hypothetical protein
MSHKHSHNIYFNHDKRKLTSHNISMDLFDAMAGGYIKDSLVVQKFGSNNDAGGTEEMLWSQSGAYTWLADHDTIVVTGGAEDDAGQTGALTVLVQGLDNNFDVQEETVTMAGAGGVTTTNKFRRVHRMKVMTAGSAGWNVGAITAAATGGGNVSHIPATYNQSMQANYTVPRNYNGWILRWYASSASNQTIDVYMRVREAPVTSLFQVKHKIHVFRGYVDEKFETPILVDEMSDIYMSTVASASSDVSGGFDLVGLKEL